MHYFMINDQAKCFGRKVNQKRINKKLLRMDKHFCQNHYNIVRSSNKRKFYNFNALFTKKSRTCKPLLISLKLLY